MSHICKTCFRQYSSYQSLCNHKRKYHCNDNNKTMNIIYNNNEITIEKPDKLTCRYCKKIYSHQNNRWKHEKICKEKLRMEKAKEEEERERQKREKEKEEEKIRMEEERIQKQIEKEEEKIRFNKKLELELKKQENIALKLRLKLQELGVNNI